MSEQAHLHIRLIKPQFDSEIVKTIMNLNSLREESFRLSGTTPKQLFFQMRNIFSLIESVGSARIEGNHTTISEYADAQIKNSPSKEERFKEIGNIEEAMRHVEKTVFQDTPITHTFIRELHTLTVSNLQREGDPNPGQYRGKNVRISGAVHVPPEHTSVQPYMDELLNFINHKDPAQFDLLKIASCHHRFCWIHPFNNGNGRVVRLLTYALLIKFGFSIKNGILNPTAVFCNNREIYYEKLAIADKGTDSSLEEWCQYVLSGFQKQFEKVRSITKYDELKKTILLPALEHASEKSIISPLQYKILKKCLEIPHAEITAKNIREALPDLTDRQRQYQIRKTLDESFLVPSQGFKRTYTVNFEKSTLVRSLIYVLYKQGYAQGLENAQT